MIRRGSIMSRLLVASLVFALVAMFVPAPLRAAPTPKASCCAHMQMPSDSAEHCPRHDQTPDKPQQDTACCQACALGLALLFIPASPLVYEQTGEASLVSLSARSYALPHPPPVPPPRTASV